MNPDIDNYSVTQADLKKFQKSLTDKLGNATELKHLCLMFFACHGMSKYGTQHIVLNEFDGRMYFYKLYDAENKIRLFSKLFKNCYFISIFACCRELFFPHKHTNCVSASSIAEAEQKIEQVNKEKTE